MTKRKLIAIVLTVLTLLLLAVSVPPARAQFVLSAWDFPDAYGQGIEGFEIFGNKTGSWIQLDGYYTAGDNYVIDWNATVAIKLRCYTWFNSTLTGAGSAALGKLLQRHNVTVMDINDVVVFSQQNFTYYSVDTGIDPPLWFYGYEVVLNFLPDFGQLYSVTVNYEVFW